MIPSNFPGFWFPRPIPFPFPASCEDARWLQCTMSLWSLWKHSVSFQVIQVILSVVQYLLWHAVPYSYLFPGAHGPVLPYYILGHYLVLRTKIFKPLVTFDGSELTNLFNTWIIMFKVFWRAEAHEWGVSKSEGGEVSGPSENFRWPVLTLLGGSKGFCCLEEERRGWGKLHFLVCGSSF